MAGGLAWMTFKGLFQLKPFCDFGLLSLPGRRQLMDKGKGPNAATRGSYRKIWVWWLWTEIWGSRAEGWEVVEVVQGKVAKEKGQQAPLLTKRVANVLGQEKLTFCFVGYRAAENISGRKHSHSSTVEGNSKLLQ